MNLFDAFIKNNFGSRSGALMLIKSRALELFGRYGNYRKINWAAIECIVFVCKGNICRSPLGEAVAIKAGIHASSYGLDTSDGKPADPRAIDFATSISTELSNHKTRRIKHYSPKPSDLIIVMEPAQLEYFKSRALNGAHLTLLGLWLPSSRPYLHDPFNSTPTYFTHCEKLVHEATNKVVANIMQSRTFELKSRS